MYGKKYYVNCAGYLCNKESSSILSAFDCADLLNEKDKLIEEYENIFEDIVSELSSRYSSESTYHCVKVGISPMMHEKLNKIIFG